MQKTLFSFFSGASQSTSSQKSTATVSDSAQAGQMSMSQPSPTKASGLYSAHSNPSPSQGKLMASPTKANTLFSSKQASPKIPSLSQSQTQSPFRSDTSKATGIPTQPSPVLPIARYGESNQKPNIPTSNKRKIEFHEGENKLEEDDAPIFSSNPAVVTIKPKATAGKSLLDAKEESAEKTPTKLAQTRSGRSYKKVFQKLDEDEEDEKDDSAENDNDVDYNGAKDAGDFDHDDDDDALLGDEVDENEGDDYENDEDAEIEFNTPSKKKAKIQTTPKKSTPSKATGKLLSSSRPVPMQVLAKGENPYRSSTHDNSRFDWLDNLRDAKGVRKGEPGYDPSTLYIPPAAMQRLTAFEKQYWEVKKAHFDTVVFFKKGKFYELYEQDADIGNQLLGLKLTDRVNMRMAGVPEASFNMWASQLIKAGYKVAKVDEVESNLSMQKRKKENPKDGKFGSVKSVMQRELTSILTVGTISDPDLIQNMDSNFLLAIKEFEGLNKVGVCLVDVSTSTFHIAQFDDDARRTQIETLCLQMKPKEILVEKKNLSTLTNRIIRLSVPSATITALEPEKQFWGSQETIDYLSRSSMYGTDTPKSSKWPPVLRKMATNELAISCLGAVISYLISVKSDPSIILLNRIQEYSATTSSTSMVLDGQTLLNLEILENTYDGGSEGTLLHLLDYTSTPFGRRLFRSWVCHPLRHPAMINARLDAVQFLMNIGDQKELYQVLKKLPDLERLLSRVQTKSCRVPEFLSVIEGFGKIQKIRAMMADLFSDTDSEILKNMISPLGAFRDLDDNIVVFEKSFDLSVAREQGVISPSAGADAEYDKVVAEVNALHAKLDNHLEEQKKLLKLSTIAYKDVGKELYQIEIPAKALEKISIPSHYILMSQTKTAKRYWTPFIQTCFNPLKEAEEKQSDIRDNFLTRLQEKFDQRRRVWRTIVDAVAEFDALLSLARASVSFGAPSCRPNIIEAPEPQIHLKSMRHPFAKTTGDSSTFIPNDTIIGGKKESQGENPKIILLTGPNMGGKSTLLRQTSLAVILAQLGCYVPAEECTITPVDRIFTRLGARDNIIAGQSTFMVELQETSSILKHSTKNSLVILDELGRGTSTFDGFSIAYAVLQYIASNISCRCLFSTHYHMLTDEFINHPVVALKHMACHVDEASHKVTFLYRLSDGICPKSYGMNVAGMAGIPKELIDRADSIASSFEEATLESIQKRRDFIQLDLEAKSNYQFISTALHNESPKKAYEGIISAWYTMFAATTGDDDFVLP